MEKNKKKIAMISSVISLLSALVFFILIMNDFTISDLTLLVIKNILLIIIASNGFVQAYLNKNEKAQCITNLCVSSTIVLVIIVSTIMELI
ncbi:MAG: hypothetical protein R3Y05_00670 [bacterium]